MFIPQRRPLAARDAVAQVRRGAFGEITEAPQAVLTAAEPASKEIGLSETPLRIGGWTYATTSKRHFARRRRCSLGLRAAAPQRGSRDLISGGFGDLTSRVGRIRSGARPFTG